MNVFAYDLYFNSVTKFYECWENGHFIFKTRDKPLFINKVLSLLDRLGGDFPA